MTASQSPKPCRTPLYSHPTAVLCPVTYLSTNVAAKSSGRDYLQEPMSKKPPTDPRDRVPLFPAGLPFALSPGARISLPPLRNRAGFVVVHLLVHANTIRPNNRGCAARLVAVVSDALIGPLEVIGVHLLGECGIGRHQSS